MTYLEPSNLFGKIFRWTAQCQDKTIQEQYQKGIRFFDLRLQWENKDTIDPYFAHGLCKFKGINPQEIFQFLNTNSDNDIYVRVGLETFQDCSDWSRESFMWYINKLKRNYEKLKYQFFIKNPWEIIEDQFDKELLQIQTTPTWKNILLGPKKLKELYQENPKDYKETDMIIAGDFIL